MAKYAHATHAEVRLSASGGELAFEVVDDGDGFDPGSTRRGSGLEGMADALTGQSANGAGDVTPEQSDADPVGDQSETLLIGTDFGIVTDIETGPNGNLFVVSLSNGALYEIRRR